MEDWGGGENMLWRGAMAKNYDIMEGRWRLETSQHHLGAAYEVL